ncbi:MAG: FAD-dependent oxidoreductase, partial [Armatimonadota bacterium]
YPDLRLAPEISGTPDGLAKAPYHREGRRLKARFTMREQDVSEACNPGCDRAVEYPDAVGVGCYAIDLHPAANGEMGLEARALPFQIPLGALLPERVTNVIAAGKGIGVTHITNGCTRLHPVEWVIGEAAGLLAGYCLKEDKTPHQIHESAEETKAFQQFLESEGVETQWPTLRAMW